MVLLVAVALLPVWAVLFWLRKRQKIRTGDHPLSRLEYYPSALPLSGKLGNLVVRVERRSVGRAACHIEVGNPGAFIVSELGPADAQAAGASGDPEFDEQVQSKGNDAQLSAALDAKTREHLLAAVERGLRFDDGYFRIELDEEGLTPGKIRAAISELQALAECLSWQTSDELLHKLQKNAAEDPVSGVRLRNLAHLADLSWENAAIRALTQGISDSSPEVRLLAASRLVDIGGLSEHLAGTAFAVLVKLLAASFGGEVRAGAARALGAGFELDKIRPFLVPLLHDSDDAVRHRAAESLTFRGWNPDAGGLALVDRQSQEGGLSLADDGGQLTLADGASRRESR